MGAVTAWGWYDTGKVWLPIEVDEDGLVKVDMSAINLADLNDITIAALADGHFLSYSVGLGYWQNRLLAEGDIPAAIARDTEVVNAIIAHALLKTGIHGVGARYVAETSVEDLDLADHQARHKWGGADVFDYGEILAGIRAFWPINWITHDEWTEDHTGTGSISWSLLMSTLVTGATNGSRAKIRTGIGPDFGGNYARCKFRVQAKANGLGNSTIWLGSFAANAPTDTVRHAAFKIINGAIWASSADGTTQEITDLGIDKSAAWSAMTLYYKHLSTSIEFYVDGALKATHTTYLGGGANHRVIFEITNSVAATRDLRLKQMYMAINLSDI